MNLNKKYNL